MVNGRLEERHNSKIQNWVKNGGTLIGYRRALNYLKSNKLLNLELKKSQLVAKNITREQAGDFRGAQVIGGAIFATKLDRSHPINFGYKNKTLPMFRNTTLFMEPDKNSYNNPIQYTDKPLLSGYISERNLDSLANTVPLKIGNYGRGNVVGFTDNTNFRAFWYGTNKLLMNAIFFREQL